MNDGSPVIKGTSYKLNNHASITRKSWDLSIRHNVHIRCEAQSTSYTRFKVSAAKYMRSASSGILRSAQWQFLTDVSEQPIGPLFKDQEIQEERDPTGCPEMSARNCHYTLRYPRRIQISAFYTNGAGAVCPDAMHSEPNLINFFHLRLCYKRVELCLHFLIHIRGIK